MGGDGSRAPAPLAEHLEVLTHDLGPIPLLAGLPVLPRTGLEAALDEDLTATRQVLLGDLRLAPEAHDAVPLGLLLAIAVGALPPTVGGQ